MTIDLALREHIEELKKAGLRPSTRLVTKILAAGDASFAPLLELACAVEMMHEDEPQCYAPLHALRLLGEMPRPEMVQPLLSKLPVTLYDEQDEPTKTWGADVPQIIARMGSIAHTPLRAMIDDAERLPPQRAAALVAMSYTVAVAPEVRDELRAELKQRLAVSEDPMLNAYLIVGMSDLGMSEMYGDVMQMYRDQKIDRMIVPPATARQLLLTQDNQRLRCVTHPFWERYDEHGPFEDSADYDDDLL